MLRERERRWNALRDDIQIGLDQLDQGKRTPQHIADIKERGR